MMRFSLYFTLSLSLCAAVCYHGWVTRVQFYSTVVYLTTNKFTFLALGNAAVALTLALGRFAKLVFLGSLRDMELEILYENSRFAVTETCLALTIFREELDTKILVLFTTLLFFKAFHWLAAARVEHIEQTDDQRTRSHVRLVALQLVLLLADILIVQTCVLVLLEARPSVLILFAFEFAILGVAALSTFLRYLLHLVDTRVEGTWHNKNSYIFFLEFLTEVLRFIFYLIFFGIIFSYYGMPLHIVRDLWVSYSNLRRRLQTYNRYRELTANMNERFPNATEEELEACEHTCIICRDHMEEGKKLACGHIFHFQCLRLWLQQQQTCPTCRTEITARQVPAAPAAPRPNAENNVRQQADAAAGAGAGVAEREVLAPAAEGQLHQPQPQPQLPNAAPGATPGSAQQAAMAAAMARGLGAMGNDRRPLAGSSGSAGGYSPVPRPFGHTPATGSMLSSQGLPAVPGMQPFGWSPPPILNRVTPLSILRVVGAGGVDVREQVEAGSKVLRSVPPGTFLTSLQRHVHPTSGAISHRLSDGWVSETDGNVTLLDAQAPPQGMPGLPVRFYPQVIGQAPGLAPVRTQISHPSELAPSLAPGSATGLSAAPMLAPGTLPQMPQLPGNSAAAASALYAGSSLPSAPVVPAESGTTSTREAGARAGARDGTTIASLQESIQDLQAMASGIELQMSRVSLSVATLRGSLKSLSEKTTKIKAAKELREKKNAEEAREAERAATEQQVAAATVTAEAATAAAEVPHAHEGEVLAAAAAEAEAEAEDGVAQEEAETKVEEVMLGNESKTEREMRAAAALRRRKTRSEVAET
ncbi:unnamed protein product [Chrysoparadoxa australica]